jgi:mannose-6-phosphate isomerase-like protein (cupin superfamily)
MKHPVHNLDTAFESISGYWKPHRVTSINDYDVKAVKIEGEFVWHSHPDTDEMFMVISGELTIQFRDGNVVLGPNDIYVVPKGIEHCPRAESEVHVLLFEPKGTANTGDAGGERTERLREL